MLPNKTSTGSLITLIMFLIISCQTATSPAANDSKKDTVTAETPLGDPTTLAFGGNLDELYIAKTDILNLTFNNGNKQVVWAFTFNQNGKPTLHGWKSKRNGNADEFDTPPNLKLLNGLQTSKTFGSATYFGNLTILKQKIVDIQNALTTRNGDFVVLRPNNEGNVIEYVPFVIKGNYPAKVKDATSPEILAEFPVPGAILNPSPPRRYSFQ